MHVLVTADTIGGVWTYTRELVCGLIGRGHCVTLVSFGKLPTSAQTVWMQDKSLVYHATEFPLEWMQNSEAGIIESANYLEKLISQLKPDLLLSAFRKSLSPTATYEAGGGPCTKKCHRRTPG